MAHQSNINISFTEYLKARFATVPVDVANRLKRSKVAMALFLAGALAAFENGEEIRAVATAKRR